MTWLEDLTAWLLIGLFVVFVVTLVGRRIAEWILDDKRSVTRCT